MILGIHFGLHAEVDAFGQPLQQTGNANLIDHLGQLPAARRTEVSDRTRVAGQHRLCALEGIRVTAAKDGELAVLCASLATGNRRIDEGRTLRLELCRHVARQLGGCGAVVDDNDVSA